MLLCTTNCQIVSLRLGAAVGAEPAGMVLGGHAQSATVFSIAVAQETPPRWPCNRLFFNNGGGGTTHDGAKPDGAT